MEVKELEQRFEQAVENVKSLADDWNGKIKSNEELSTKAKERADEALNEMAELKQQIDNLKEVKVEKKSLGASFLQHKKSHASMTSVKDKIEYFSKAMTSTTAGNWGETLTDRNVFRPTRRFDLLDLIGVSEIEQNAISYIKETGFTNNAAFVAEGALKPESNLTFENALAPLNTVAHWLNISTQMLEDGGALLADYIDNRLVYGLRLAIENQVLSGDGVGINMMGIITQATEYSNPTGSSAAANNLDRLRNALLQVSLAEYPADAIVLNPIDWANIEKLKGADNRYLIGNPQDGTAKRIWGLLVIESLGMPRNHYLVGSFNAGCQLYRKGGVRIEAAYENQDNFIRNMVTIRAEERIALAVYRPESFVYGELTT